MKKIIKFHTILVALFFLSLINAEVESNGDSDIAIGPHIHYLVLKGDPGAYDENMKVAPSEKPQENGEISADAFLFASSKHQIEPQILNP